MGHKSVKIQTQNNSRFTITHRLNSSESGSTEALSQIVGFHIYETQEEHDHRIQLENFRYQYGKKRSRQEARNLRARRPVLRRADHKCEICRLDFGNILVLHHIMPVSLGGSAERTNLIALCPNCHALVHNYRHFKSERTARDKYPGWKRGIAKARLTEEQADRLLLVASKDARVLPDGSIVPHKEPQELVSVIVDEHGKPIDERFDPVRIQKAIEHIEEVFGAGD